jgi:hypothetical protein
MLSFKFLGVGGAFLLIVWLSGNIDNPSCLCKQLLIVCSHNIAIGLLFDKSPEGIYVGFPHFGPMSVDVPYLRMLARFWSYEMVAIRAATALRPFFLPGLFASFMSLIIPQMAVFSPSQLGTALSNDYFKNPISFASVNGFPALNWLMWFLYRGLSKESITSVKDLFVVWFQPLTLVEVDYLAIALGLLPFIIVFAYKTFAAWFGWTPPRKAPADGRTFFSLNASIAPCCLYLLLNGWGWADVHKLVYAHASIMPIWWVSCCGGVDLWIEEPMGYPARFIAFTPTWIVSHGVFFLQWALEPDDYINRLVFVLYMLPQMLHLNHYFRVALVQDWGTQLPIFYSYLMIAHMAMIEVCKWWIDFQVYGIGVIAKEVVKDCPLHFTVPQLIVFFTIWLLVALSPSATYRWALYSSCGPLNWLGIM